MHLTLGILRQSQAVFYAGYFFWLDGFAVPAPAQVTQTVSPPRNRKALKPKSKSTIGIILISLSLITLAIAVFQIVPIFFPIDLPSCKDGLDDSIVINSRIGYCLNIHPFNLINRGMVSKSGSTDSDGIIVDVLEIRRKNQSISINFHPLVLGEIYQKFHWFPSINPWLILTYRYEVKNEGISPLKSPTSPDMIFISGDVYEGWLPNPVGFIILGCGVWLIWQGRKEQKQELNPLQKAG